MYYFCTFEWNISSHIWTTWWVFSLTTSNGAFLYAITHFGSLARGPLYWSSMSYNICIIQYWISHKWWARFDGSCFTNCSKNGRKTLVYWYYYDHVLRILPFWVIFSVHNAHSYQLNVHIYFNTHILIL